MDNLFGSPLRSSIYALALVGLVFTPTAGAAVIVNGSGYATRVTDVVVGTSIYNVTFSVGSFDDVFGVGFPVSPLPLLDGQTIDAETALFDIIDQLNAAGIELLADSSGSTSDVFVIPTLHTSTRVHGVFGAINPNIDLPGVDGTWRGRGIQASRTSLGFGVGDVFSFARIEFVPEPTSLMIMGLAGLMMIRRTRDVEIDRHLNN